MKHEKSVKLIENTFKSLLRYCDSSRWKSKFASTQKAYLENVANSLNIDMVFLAKTLTDNNYSNDIYGFIFEDFCSKQFQTSSEPLTFENVSVEFQKRNNWKLNEFSVKYLQTLAKTNYGFWQVTKIDANEISLQSYPNASRNCVIYDSRLAGNIAQSSLLLAKLILVDDKVYPGAIITPIDKALVDKIIADITQGAEEFFTNYKRECLEQKIDHVHSDSYVKNVYIYNNLGYVIFKHWITYCYHKIFDTQNSVERFSVNTQHTKLDSTSDISRAMLDSSSDEII